VLRFRHISQLFIVYMGFRRCFREYILNIVILMSEPAAVTTKLKYTIPPPNGERLFRYTSIDHAPNGRITNLELEDRTVQIENLRGKENAATLDSTGFQFFRRPAKHRGFRVDEDIQKEYYLESEHLIKELTGASRVVFFDHSTSKVPDCASELMFQHSCPSEGPCLGREVASNSASGARTRRSNDPGGNQPSSPSSACSRRSGASRETFPDHQPVASHLARCI
jgi:hypothetical protein